MDEPLPDPHPNTEALQLVETVARTLMVARVLAQRGRAVDLQGLDAMVGLLCAKTLDLGPDYARIMRPQLMALRAELDALSALLPQGSPA
jgi:hypothetical protein